MDIKSISRDLCFMTQITQARPLFLWAPIPLKIFHLEYVKIILNSFCFFYKILRCVCGGGGTGGTQWPRNITFQGFEEKTRHFSETILANY